MTKKIKQYLVIKKLEMLLNCRWYPSSMSTAKLIVMLLLFFASMFLSFFCFFIGEYYTSKLSAMTYFICQLIFSISFSTWFTWFILSFMVVILADLTKNKYLIAQVEKWEQGHRRFLNSLYIDLDKRESMTNRLAQEKIAYEKMNLTNQMCEAPVRRTLKKNMNKI